MICDAALLPKGIAMDDKVKIRCPGCKQVFREKAGRVRDGFQVNCLNCSRLVTLSKENEDPFIRRALKSAKEVRAAKEAALLAATYSGVASASKRETT
jgi:hypothetical protein